MNIFTGSKQGHSWFRVVVDEGLLSVTAGGTARKKIKEELLTIDPNPNLFQEEFCEDLRRACITLKLKKNKSLAGKMKEEYKRQRKQLSELEKRKVDKVIRLAKRSIDYEVQQRVTQQLQDILPKYKKEYDMYKSFNDAYKGILSRDDYKRLVGFVHPDRHKDELAQRKAQYLFDILIKNETLLCGKKETEKKNESLPQTVDELYAMRRR